MPRGTRTRDERNLIATGVVGLALAALHACGATSTSGSHAASPGDDGATPAPSDGSTTVTAACANDGSAATGTAAVVSAVGTFLGALTSDQKSAVSLDKTKANAIQWSNFPAGVVHRNGVKLADMSTTAQAAAVALAGVAAGSTGAKMLSEVRAADDAFKSSSGDGSLFGDGQYYFSVHGPASTRSPWMLQIAGHHLAYNFVFSGKCTSATPLFDGAQPAKWTDASGTAHDPLAAQRDALGALFTSTASLDGAELAGTFSDMINGPSSLMGGTSGGNDSKYPSFLTYPTTGRGANVAAFSADQKGLVKTAIEAWVKNVADPVSAALLALYESDDALSQTYVGYSGAPDLSTTSSYARIDGPRVWIEFTVQEGTTDNMQGHYHTIWRDKVADYGADFVTQ
ncbi:MAG TPA: DUF3500 domain-containing protein [Polyangiaceae bacterium]|jgi:hypothetical protein|nr:DUF3500 domain-containing protein [Polyangiaceae bacterium]